LVFSLKPSGLLKKFQSAEVRSAFDILEKHVKEMYRKRNLKDITFECALCALVVNEIEALLAENLTQSEIEDFLQQNVCSQMSGAVKEVCLDFVNYVGVVIDNLEQHETVSVICMDLEFCETPFDNKTDLTAIPKYSLNLDLPATQRWNKICSEPNFQSLVQYIVQTLQTIFPDNGATLLEIGRMIHGYFPSDKADELTGCSNALGVDFGFMTILNLGYELSDACTSIVAQTVDGTPLHARNLDFWDGMGFTNTLRNLTLQVEVSKGGHVVYSAVTFPGYIGVLSGYKNGAFAGSINTRFYPDGLWELFYEGFFSSFFSIFFC